uniref:TLDc domain containing protein n=1 Tax=Haemonchus contortus TaxID=6289 RepID=W6NDK8_HAECO
MGNTEAKAKVSKTSTAAPSMSDRSMDKRVEQAFVRLTGSTSNCLTFGNLKDVFSEGLAESLWNYLSDSKPYDDRLTLDEFARHAPSLWGTSTDVYVKVCQPVLTLIKNCSEAAGAGAVAGDEKFIGNLVHEMCERGSSVEEIVSWKRDMCPAFCNALRDLVLHVFLGYAFDNTEYSSEILTPMQMCRGPTVSIFQLTDGSIFVLATDDTWRHSGSRFGGQATVLFEISPDLKRFASPSPPIYCNFKIRSAAFGLSFLDKMKIDKEMGNVAAIEVWGCAPSSALQDQQRLRAWQSKQAEKIKKVPLPGNWDDNPDKTILEMAGIQFSNERKLMEMEAKARQNDNL